MVVVELELQLICCCLFGRRNGEWCVRGCLSLWLLRLVSSGWAVTEEGVGLLNCEASLGSEALCLLKGVVSSGCTNHNPPWMIGFPSK